MSKVLKMNEIKNFSKEELENKISEFKREMFDLRMQNYSKKLSDPLKIRCMRKNIAKIFTVLNQNN